MGFTGLGSKQCTTCSKTHVLSTLLNRKFARFDSVGKHFFIDSTCYRIV